MRKNSCSICGVSLTIETASPFVVKAGSGYCRNCYTTRWRKYHPNANHRSRQHLGERHTFPCGCSGLLPQFGEPQNQFAKKLGTEASYSCRVYVIISRSVYDAKRRGHQPIPANTSHAEIRRLMNEPNCERCGKPLVWEFGIGKTPHLHHNHETGEIYGFTHARCNPHAMEQEIERLRHILAGRLL